MLLIIMTLRFKIKVVKTKRILPA